MRQFLILLIALWGLSSCTTNATFTFHKNQTTSLLAEVDMEGILKFTGDSIMKSFTNKELSKNWKSLYQISKEKGEPITHKDTIELAKRMFLKGLYKGEVPYGFALKADRISQKQWSGMEKISKSENTKYGDLLASVFKWDGKTLIFDPQELTKIGKKEKLNSPKEESSEASKEEIKATSDETSEAAASSETIQKIESPFQMKINLFCKFDRKIKSIQGNHPYLQQIDEHTLQFSFNALDKHPKERGDSKIIIITK